jgi:hypothetical protein
MTLLLEAQVAPLGRVTFCSVAINFKKSTAAAAMVAAFFALTTVTGLLCVAAASLTVLVPIRASFRVKQSRSVRVLRLGRVRGAGFAAGLRQLC